RHLAADVVEDVFGDPAVVLVLEESMGIEVDAGELGVVVEHLLEMGYEPDRVDRIAVKPAADLVVNPAGGHLVERQSQHLGRTIVARRSLEAKKKFEQRSLGELWRAAKSAVLPVELATQRPNGIARQIGRELTAFGLSGARLPQEFADLLGAFEDLTLSV